MITFIFVASTIWLHDRYNIQSKCDEVWPVQVEFTSDVEHGCLRVF